MSAPSSSSSTSLAEMYERALVGPLFRPWVDDLLDRVTLAAGDRVLDVACGTGIVSRVAKERLGRDAVVVGVDASAAMLTVARHAAPALDWREGSASALPTRPGERFDVVVCQQGLQFFPDKPAAARELRRVLDAGGRAGVATWRPLDDVPFFRELHAIAERYLGPVVDLRHSFGVAGDLDAVLTAAGFRDVHVETVARTIHFEEPSTFLWMNARALVGMSPTGRQRDDVERERLAAAIAADSSRAASPYAGPAGLSFELSTNIATARA